VLRFLKTQCPIHSISYAQFTPPTRTRQDCPVLSGRWCEQNNWRQFKTVFSSSDRISKLNKTVSKFSVADSLDLSPILTRQDNFILSVSAVRTFKLSWKQERRCDVRVKRLISDQAISQSVQVCYQHITCIRSLATTHGVHSNTALAGDSVVTNDIVNSNS